MADAMCAVWCNACSTGDRDACAQFEGPVPAAGARCQASCPAWLRDMGQAFDDPLESTLESFVADKANWAEDGEGPGGGADAGGDRDARARARAHAAGAGRAAQVPVPLTNRTDVWGGGLRRMTVGDVGPRRDDGPRRAPARREDEHYYAPRYVPVGFARYVDPTVDPADYTFYLLSGWRVAVPRTVPSPAVGDLLRRIYRYGPGSAGYARLGDTLVPALLGPGDRQTLAGSESRLGPSSQKYPLA